MEKVWNIAIVTSVSDSFNGTIANTEFLSNFSFWKPTFPHWALQTKHSRRSTYVYKTRISLKYCYRNQCKSACMWLYLTQSFWAIFHSENPHFRIEPCKLNIPDAQLTFMRQELVSKNPLLPSLIISNHFYHFEALHVCNIY